MFTVRNIKAPKGDGNASHAASITSCRSFKLETSKPRKGTETNNHDTQRLYKAIQLETSKPGRGRKLFCYLFCIHPHINELETSKPRKGTEIVKVTNQLLSWYCQKHQSPGRGRKLARIRRDVLSSRLVRNIKAPEGDGNAFAFFSNAVLMSTSQKHQSLGRGRKPYSVTDFIFHRIVSQKHQNPGRGRKLDSSTEKVFTVVCQKHQSPGRGRKRCHSSFDAYCCVIRQNHQSPERGRKLCQILIMVQIV